MKKLQISSRGWIMIAVAGLVLMFGAVKVVKDRQPGGTEQAPASSELPLNTLTDDPVPPMEETPLLGPSAKPSSLDKDPHPELPLEAPSADASAASPAVVPTNPIVWVSAAGVFGYQQPGLNMKRVRPLTKWEELQLVVSSKEGWDRVRDESGAEFWVEKKVVTVIRPQNLSRPSVAEEKVMSFYNNVAEGLFNEAYVQLSPDWKRELSFNDFVEGYARTDSLRTEITNVYELGEDRFQVDVSMLAVEEGEPVNYLGIYTVEKIGTVWYMTTGRLMRQPDGFQT